mmetsp:Transcript_45449/g.137766  ORF Transcript_45449/g.137766 Transcript_45449/m.137766 type:complete len:332 (+) Transcript_45449:466-1461(+)
MLDMRGGRVQHAGEECFAPWHVDARGAPDVVLVRMPRVASLHRNKLGGRAEHDVRDVLERHVVVMRPRVVAPAHVHADIGGVQGSQGVVHDLHVPLGHGLELLQRLLLVLGVPTHPQVGAIQLKHQARILDGLVLRSHGLANGLHESVVILGPVLMLVIYVAEEGGQGARGRGAEEDPFQRHVELLRRLHNAVDLLLQVLQALFGECDRSRTRGGLHLGVFGEGEQPLPIFEFGVRILSGLVEVASAGGDGFAIEARQPFAGGRHVVLACELAVIDNIQADVQLLLHDLLGLLEQLLLPIGRRDLLTAEERHHPLGARQGPYRGGQDLCHG